MPTERDERSGDIHGFRHVAYRPARAARLIGLRRRSIDGLLAGRPFVFINNMVGYRAPRQTNLLESAAANCLLTSQIRLVLPNADMRRLVGLLVRHPASLCR